MKPWVASIQHWLASMTASVSKPISGLAPASMGAEGRIIPDKSYLIRLQRAADSLSLKASSIRAVQGGNYLSSFRGRGMEFDEVRRYQAGDDIRCIDWRVTARTGNPHTKLYREERERPILVCVDLRSSMHFATRSQFKSVMACNLACLIGWGAVRHADRLGGFIFSEADHRELRPKRGKSSVLSLIKLLCDFSSWNASSLNNGNMGGNMSTAFSRIRRVTKPGSLVFIFSDFRDLDRQSEMHLTQLSQHNELVLVMISDPLERALPPAGVYRISNGTTEFDLSTYNKVDQLQYQQQFSTRVSQLQRLCKRTNIRLLPISTHEDGIAVLRTGLGVSSQ